MNPKHFSRRPSRSVRVLSSLILLWGMVAAVATWATSSIVDKREQPAMVMAGIVTDSMCGRTHGAKAHGDALCTRLCVEMGAEYALAVGKKIYLLRGRWADLDRFAGAGAIVKGRIIDRDTILVESVTPLIAISEAATNVKYLASIQQK